MELYPKTKSLIIFLAGYQRLLFAGLSYNKLIKNHFKHHKNPGKNLIQTFIQNHKTFLFGGVIFSGDIQLLHNNNYGNCI
jgi:hypothetical protein